MAYMIWVTAACNLRCKYCYEGNEKSKNNMSKTTAENAIEFIKRDFDYKKNPKLIINFHGGEPLLNFELIKFFVSELKEFYKGKCKLSFTFTTNVTILTSEIIDYIVKEGIEPTLSIDGNKETHDLLRVFPDGRGSHDFVMLHARELQKRVYPIRISMVYNSQTVHSLSTNVKYLLEEGFDVIAANTDLHDARWDEAHLIVLEQEILKVKQLLKNYPKARVSVCEKLPFRGPDCRGGGVSKHIYYNGDLYPCVVTCGIPEFKIGTVQTGVNQEKRNILLSHSCTNNSECQQCDLSGYCMTSRCTLINKVVTGDYTKPIPIGCNYTRLIHRLWGIYISDDNQD